MRLLALKLTAFGPFTNGVIDFDSVDAPGLHVVYGPNEAGKSAALRAITDLFFGIPHQSPDGFLHSHGDLRIGGLVRRPDGSQLAFIRRKGHKNTLLDEEERPLDDSVLQNTLSGMTREMFAGMFGIDHQRLREGGRQLIAGEGDVAVGLYAAALGMSGLRGLLKDLRGEAEGLFKPTGKTPSINRLIIEYKELRKQVSDFSLPGREWLELRGSVEKTEEELAELKKDLLRLESLLNRLQRFEKAIPLAAERRAAFREVETLGNAQLLASNFGKERRVFESRLQSARQAEQRATASIAKLNAEIAGLAVPRELLSQEALIKEIHERLGSHRKALQDKPRLCAKMEQLRTDALAILREFSPRRDLDEVEGLRLLEQEKLRIQNLGARFQSFETMREKAAADAKKIEAELAAARVNLERIEPPRDPSDLKRTVRQAQSRGNLDERLASLRDQLRQDGLELDIALRTLPIWTGNLEELERLPLPLSETVQRFDARFQETASRWKGNEERLREAKTQAEEISRQVDALRRAGAVPTEEDLARARERRDVGWRLVKKSWLEGPPEPRELRQFDPEDNLPAAYEASVRGADEIADRLRREADRVAQLAQLLVGRDGSLSKIVELERISGEIAAEHTGVEAEWLDLWREAGLGPLSPREMLTWLAQKEKLIEKARALRLLQIERDRIEETISGERRKLGACLESLSAPAAVPGETMADLLERCEGLVNRIESASRKREKLEEKIRDIEKRRASAEEEIRQAEFRMAEWRKPWAECMQRLGLGADAAPVEANAALVRNQEMFGKLDEAWSLAARIEGIRQDAALFAADSRSLIERVAPDLLEIPIEQAVGELHTRFTTASKAAATFEQLVKQKKAEMRLQRENRLAADEATAGLDGLCGQAGCTKHEELEAAEEQSERLRSLRNGIDGLNARLMTLSGGMDLEAFVAEAGETDADAIPAQVAETKLQIAECEARRSELDRRIGSERTRLAAMDGTGKALEAAEKAESTLARLKREVERYARVHLASTILSREIDRYREVNEGPVLRSASEIFSRLTLGSFATLKPVFDRGDRPVLAGFRPDGRKVPVSGMSEGTLDQLYLSLRLASLRMQAESGETMPFIADDILINFDDARSEATLKVLAELSRKTQIVFFTHHRRLLDLAESAASPDLLKVHRLTGSPGTA